jgi:hypothetical protein
VAAQRGFRDRLAISVAAMTFYGSFLCAVSAALWAARQAVLCLVYGPVAVGREGLRLVKLKPGLVVSNGDRLDDWGFPLFLITTAIWVPLLFLLIAAVWGWLPVDYRRRLPPPDRPFAQASSADAVFLFVPLLLTVVLWASVGMGMAGVTLLALALATAWLTARREGGGQAAPPAGVARPESGVPPGVERPGTLPGCGEP